MNNEEKWSEEKSSIISKLLFLWTGRYINYVNNEKKASSPLHIPEKYSLPIIEKKYEKYWEKHSYTKKNFFLCNYRVFGLEFLFYTSLLILSIALSYMTPMLFHRIAAIIKGGKSSSIVVVELMSIFFMVQLCYAIVKTHATHFKWKLVTAIDYNSKNLVYRNMLKSDLTEFNQGKILNVYSAHTSKLKGIIGLVELVINSIGSILGIYALFQFLGKAGLISGLCFVFIMVISSKFTFLQDKFDKQNYDINELRLKNTATLLEKIREIKLLNYGHFFCKKLKEIRNQQSDILKKRCKIQLFFVIYETSLIPVFTAISLLLAGVVFRVPLKTTDILTSFIIFDLLDSFVNQVFMALNSFRMCLKSLEYIIDFLGRKNIAEKLLGDKKEIRLERVSLKKEDTFILKDLEVHVSNPKMLTISGAVASGKSMLLKALNGDIIADAGKIEVNGITSFISNEGWFLNESIKDNIVLGKEFDQQCYEEAINFSCMEKDLETFLHRDMQIITDNGSNLSGGQRVRLQIARAIYQKADIILIDDVFASLDEKTREEIIQKLLLGYWKNTIRIIATNEESLLYNADTSYNICNKRLEKYIYEKQKYVKTENENGYEKVIRTNKKNVNVKKQDRKEEDISTRGVLTRYLRRISFKGMWFFFVFFFVFSQVIDMLVKSYSTKIENPNHSIYIFTVVYCLLVVFSTVISAVRCAIVYYGNIKAGKIYHEQLVENIVKAKYSYMDNAFLNKAKTIFSNDIRIFDDNIADYFVNVFQAIVLMVTTYVMLMCSNILNVVFATIFMVIFYYGQKAGKNVTTYVVKECNRANEPCIGFLCNTYSGKRIINQFQCENYMKRNWKTKLEQAYDYEYTRQSVNRYELLKINLAAVCLLTMFLIISLITKANISFVMVTITYMLSIIAKFEDILRNIRHAEIGLTSLKRIEYMEHFVDVNDTKALPEVKIGTMCENALEVKNLACHYGDGNYIIRDCNFVIKKGEHVLIQGKSGIGKTTIFNCFERLIDYEGTILFFGIDIKKVTPETIREKMFILTQNALVFDGTIKNNLDPYNCYSEEQLKSSLSRFGLDRYSVHTECSQLSEGEKQLLCLVRAHLKQPLVLLMDEGMDSLDLTIKRNISEFIHKEFKDCTIVSISHLGNEMNYEGKIVLHN